MVVAPTTESYSVVNQARPSAPKARAAGPDCWGMPAVISLIWPSVVTRPIPAPPMICGLMHSHPDSANHRAPSGPTVIALGFRWGAGVGKVARTWPLVDTLAT